MEEGGQPDSGLAGLEEKKEPKSGKSALWFLLTPDSIIQLGYLLMVLVGGLD